MTALINSQYYTQKESLASRNVSRMQQVRLWPFKMKDIWEVGVFKIKIFIYINVLCYIKGLKKAFN